MIVHGFLKLAVERCIPNLATMQLDHNIRIRSVEDTTLLRTSCAYPMNYQYHLP